MMVCAELLEFDSSPRLTLVTGGRGIDAISKTANGTTTVVYPVYDAHGNMVADVSKYGSSFQVNDKRSFDAWGNIRQGAQTGDPKGRYYANLGHKQDDESGLIYMRARYYEPTSGRFISEDNSRYGGNWLVFCNDDPVGMADNSGRWPYLIGLWVSGILCLLGAAIYIDAEDNPAASVGIGLMAVGTALLIADAISAVAEAVDKLNIAQLDRIETPFLNWVNQGKESGNVAEVLIAAVSEMNYWLAVDLQE